MASNRHLGRIIALQTLYEQDFRVECGDKAFDLDDVLERNIQRYHDMVDDRDFIVRLVDGVNSKQLELDELLKSVDLPNSHAIFHSRWPSRPWRRKMISTSKIAAITMLLMP